LGNAVSFVITWLWARAHSGSLHLRIDDLDGERKEARYVADIFEQLNWLGLDWDSGPRSPQDFEQNWTQQRRQTEYRAALDALREHGALFACDCTRSQILKLSPSGLYPGSCRDRALPFEGGDRAWRLRATNEAQPLGDLREPTASLDVSAAMGDFVVLRRDGLPSYQIASLVDDRLDAIDFVVRGDDLRSSTAAQRLLATRLGWDWSPRGTLHHPLLAERGAVGKLSKSHDSLSIKEARGGGLGPSDVFLRVARVLGLELQGRPSLADLRLAFDPGNLIREGFATEKDAWTL
jgi:glutamyl/glutaminyl-tRNA synthetase